MVLQPTGNIKRAKTGEKDNQSEEAKLSWLRQILEWQKEMSDNKEFLSSIKNDLNLFLRQRILLYTFG